MFCHSGSVHQQETFQLLWIGRQHVDFPTNWPVIASPDLLSTGIPFSLQTQKLVDWCLAAKCLMMKQYFSKAQMFPSSSFELVNGS
jgi:hypothetical protein